jgi:hypothetical protein
VFPPALAQESDKATAKFEDIATSDTMIMVPMRDGVRLATDIYRPKNATGKVGTVFVKTPYNFNYWDVRNRIPADMTAALTAVKRGYAYVVQSAGISSRRATTTSSARQSPTATMRWTGSRSGPGRTARSARLDARPPPSTSRRSPQPAIRRSRQ